jgi:hypothetical protein
MNSGSRRLTTPHPWLTTRTNPTTYGSDAKAAFLGLILGAIVLFGIIRTIVALTQREVRRREAGGAKRRSRFAPARAQVQRRVEYVV